MKILVLGNIADTLSSKADVVLLKRLTSLGNIQLVTSHENEAVNDLRSAGIEVLILKPKSKFDWRGRKRLKRFMQGKQYDLIQSLTSKYTALVAPIKPIGTILVSYRGAFRHYWYDPFNYLTHYHPKVDAIWTISKAVQAHMKKNDLLGRKRIFCVYKGVDESWVNTGASASPEGLANNKKIVISCVANNRPIKGIVFLLKAFNEIPNDAPIELNLVGQGYTDEFVAKYIENPQMRAKVKLLGFRRDIFSILETTDIYVQPSVKEGLGKTIMEAMLCRCATIVTDSGGPSEIVENNKSGLVVEKENSMALKEALIYLLDHGEEMINMQKAANRRICTYFTMDAMFEGLKKQYMELVSA